MPRNSKSTKKQRSNAALRHSQRKDPGSISCPYCDMTVRKRGMGSHRIHTCKGLGGGAASDIIGVDDDLARPEVEFEQQEQDIVGE